jgi:hypothetical protein
MTKKYLNMISMHCLKEGIDNIETHIYAVTAMNEEFIKENY